MFNYFNNLINSNSATKINSTCKQDQMHSYSSKIIFKKLKNIQVNTKLFLSMVELAGESPVHISHINSSDDTSNLQLGDIIIKVNNRNVTRALAKSVKQSIK
jgi:hypothetical protein